MRRSCTCIQLSSRHPTMGLTARPPVPHPYTRRRRSVGGSRQTGRAGRLAQHLPNSAPCAGEPQACDPMLAKHERWHGREDQYRWHCCSHAASVQNTCVPGDAAKHIMHPHCNGPAKRQQTLARAKACGRTSSASSASRCMLQASQASGERPSRRRRSRSGCSAAAASRRAFLRSRSARAVMLRWAGPLEYGMLGSWCEFVHERPDSGIDGR